MSTPFSIRDCPSVTYCANDCLAFVDMLNSMHVGDLNPATVQMFKSLSKEIIYNDGLVPTELYAPVKFPACASNPSCSNRFPTRNEVDTANANRLERIKEIPRPYNASDFPGEDDKGNCISFEKMEKLLDNLVAPKTVILKVCYDNITTC